MSRGALAEAIREAKAELDAEDPDDDAEGADDEVDSTMRTENARLLAAYEQGMVKAVQAAGWSILRLVPTPHGTVQQVVVTGNGNLVALKAALADYLVHSPFVWVEAVLENYGEQRQDRFLLMVRHDGCPDNPDRLAYRMDPLPNWGTYRQRVDARGIGDGIYLAGHQYTARVDLDGMRYTVGRYDTPEQASAARKAFIQSVKVS